MKQTTQWNLNVTADLDRRVRRYLDGSGRKGELSIFVEEAVRARLLQLSIKTAPVYNKPSANDGAIPSDPADSLKGDGSYGG